MAETSEVIALLKEIKKDVEFQIKLLETKVSKFEKFQDNFKNEVIETVENNSKLDETFKARFITALKNYLNTDESRDNLSKKVKEVIDKELFKYVARVLAIQGALITSILMVYLKIWIEK